MWKKYWQFENGKSTVVFTAETLEGKIAYWGIILSLYVFDYAMEQKLLKYYLETICILNKLA